MYNFYRWNKIFAYRSINHEELTEQLQVYEYKDKVRIKVYFLKISKYLSKMTKFYCTKKMHPLSLLSIYSSLSSMI